MENDNKIETEGPVKAEFWSATMGLRWRKSGEKYTEQAFGITCKEDVLVLEQRWVNHQTGKTEWREVETV